MVLAYNAREATMDLDTAIRRQHGAVLAEARVVAEELGLPGWWLNEQATSYLPARRDADAAVVLERPGLTVLAASPRHLLAMKVRAARQGDVADIVALARLVGATSAEEAGLIAAEVLRRRAPQRTKPGCARRSRRHSARALTAADTATDAERLTRVSG